MNKNQDIIQLGEKTVERVNEYLQSNSSIDIMHKFQLEEFKENIETNLQELKIEEFNLVFMGRSGKGKTTCISSILDMYYYEEGSYHQVMPSDEGGHTTCCCIEIDPFNRITNVLSENKITVFLANEETVVEVLENYCKSKIKTNNISADISEEYIAIIESKLSKEDKLYVESIMNSENHEVSKEDENTETCIRYLSNILNIEYGESPMEILIEGDDKNSILKKFGDEVYNINYGKLDKFFIPEKILIRIDRSLINIPRFINKIVDTRGIGGNERLVSRPDLKKLIDSKNTLVIYVNEYTNLDNFVKEFYNDKLIRVGTQIDELASFVVLINAYNSSITGKAKKSGKSIEEVCDDKIAKFKDDVKPFSTNEEIDKILKEDISKRMGKLRSYAEKVDVDIYNFKMYTTLYGMKREDESFYITDESRRTKNKDEIYTYIEEMYQKRNNCLIEYIYHYKELIDKCIKGNLGISGETIIDQYIDQYKEDIKRMGQVNIREKYLANYCERLMKEIYRINALTIATVAKNGGYRKRDLATIWDLTIDFNQDRINTIELLLQQMSSLQAESLLNKLTEYLKTEERYEGLKEALESYYTKQNKKLISKWSSAVKEEVNNIFYNDKYEINLWLKTREKRNKNNCTYLSALKQVIDESEYKDVIRFDIRLKNSISYTR